VQKKKVEPSSELIPIEIGYPVRLNYVSGFIFYMKRLTSGPNYEVAKAEAMPLLTAIKYFEYLQKAQEFEVTKHNLLEAKELLTELRSKFNAIETSRKQSGKGYRVAVDEINSGYYLFSDPLKELIGVLAPRVEQLNNEALEENSSFQEEKERVNAIKAELIHFVTTKGAEVSNATTGNQIADIQKRLGSEKSRKNAYGEFMDTLVQIIELMNPYMNEQKVLLKELEKINNSPLPEKLLEVLAIESKKAEVRQKMQENMAKMQDTCMRNVYEINVVEVETTLATARVRRESDYEVVDAVLLFKTHPEFFEINEKAVYQYVKSRRNEVLAEKSNSITENGLKMFIRNKV
jgi:hypothetical protein